MKPAGKEETLRAYLSQGIAMLHLDARRPGVAVPAQHQGDPHLRINLSYRYGIPDLVIDGEHVQATLSFGGRPFQCLIPWEAVFGITSQASGDGQVWPEDLPTEVMSSLSAEEKKPRAKKPKPVSGKPALVAVPSDPPAAAPAREQTPAEHGPKDPEPPKKGHLRLIR